MSAEIAGEEVATYVRARFRSAVAKVATEQPELWEFHAGERAIVGQVFFELRAMGWPQGFSVDTEWGREGFRGGLKGASNDPGIVPRSNGKGAARPDIVIHVRGETGRAANFLVAEFKSSGLSSKGAISDILKVRALVARHAYQSGVVVSLGKGSRPRDIRCLWLEASGAETPEALFVGAD